MVLFALALCLIVHAKPQCDFSGDRIVNFEDYSELAGTWGACLPWGPDGLPPELLAYWRLDRNAQDSQSEFHGQVYGDPIWLAGGNAAVGSGAIRMDGQDYIEIVNDDFPVLNSSFTIDAWIRTDGSGQDQIVISKGASSWQLGIEGQTGCVFFSCPGLAGASYLLGQTDVTDNQWYHIAGVYDQQQQKIIIYLNDTIDAENTASGVVNNRDGEIWIGGEPEVSNSRKWWHDDLDNIRIYNYAATKHEIFQHKTYHVDQAQGNDGNSGQGKLNAFRTIQKAIDTADDGDLILVWPGTYEEAVEFWEYKTLTVRSASNAAVIKAPDNYAVSFYAATPDTVLENFIICDSQIGIFVESSSPILRFLTIVNNGSGIEAYSTIHPATPQINHCIFWDNGELDVFNDTFASDITYSCMERLIEADGNFSADPLFADPNNPDVDKRDYHLKSETGRYLPQDPNNNNSGPENWVCDTQTSPCVDAGNETLNPMCEKMPNGGRLNMGAYGNTKYASQSPWPYPADLNLNGQVWWEDFYVFIDNWLFCEPETFNGDSSIN